MPVTGVALFMGMLAIVGMPPFSLFQSEFLMVGAAFGGGHATHRRALHSVRRRRLRGHGAACQPAWCWGCRRGPRRLESVVRFGRAGLRRDLVVMGFWLPGPLLELIRGAARVVAGE